MWHPMKILLLVLLIRAIHTLKQSICYGLPVESECECNSEWGVSYIDCPAVEIDINTNEGNKTYANIKCIHQRKIGIKSLPKINVGNRSKVAIGNCGLSGESIATLIDQLGIKNVKFLYMTNNIVGINFTRLLRGLIELEKLFLYSNGLTLLPADLFVDLSNVTTLFIHEKLVELPPHIFDPMDKLTELDISFNKLNQLPEGIFCNQHKLKELRLNHNRLRNLNKKSFEGATSLQILYLGYNGICRFEPDVFSLLPSLSEIYLDGNELHELPLKLFANNKNLTILEMRQSIKALKFQPSALFANLTNLQKIHITCYSFPSFQNLKFIVDIEDTRELTYIGCGSRYVPFDLIATRNWTSVTLCYNNLRLLPDTIFSDLHYLDLLDLSHNKLKSLQHGWLCNASSLILLDLSYNQLTNLSDRSFVSLGSLEELYLDNNKLRLLPDGLFNETTNIVQLSISNNQLIEISTEIFSPLAKLEELYLDNNKLYFLAAGLFNKTTNLVKLNLSYNQLNNISDEIFSPLVKLERLFLNNNNFITTSTFSFDMLISLRYISMENNHIEIKGGAFYRSDRVSPFRLPDNLQTLNLRNNSIKHIYLDWRNELLNLKELDLSFNNITTLNYRDLEFEQNGILVNLSHNQVRMIDFKNENLVAETLHKSIDLNFNPLDCNCKLMYFLLYLRRVPQSKTNFVTDNLLCAKPDDIQHKLVRKLKPEELLCSIKHPQCPFGCNCWERTHDATLLVNCSNTNLTEMPALPAIQEIALRSIELYVENNKLLKLFTKFPLGYSAVKKIYAAGNNISQIDVNDLPTELTYLDLSRNNLKRLDLDVIKRFNRKQSLTLADNPWDCDCVSRRLFLFAERRSIISDYKNMSCATPKNAILDDYFINNDLCQEDQRLSFTLVVSFLSVCLLISFIVIACYKYETEIKIWIYSHTWLREIVSESDVDDSKIYDAFVSYSHKDREFIGTTLVPELERDGPINYKLCIHVRDFIVGDYITDQIIRAINESRRTIIVLSKHYIQSPWACFEFRLAHQAAVQERRTRVIVIMYDDVGDIVSLEPIISAYLKTNTYLEWGDLRFWDRLRYALPHSVNAPPNETSQATTAV